MCFVTRYERMVVEVTICLADTSMEQALQMVHYYQELHPFDLTASHSKSVQNIPRVFSELWIILKNILIISFLENIPWWNDTYFILVEVYISFPVKWPPEVSERNRMESSMQLLKEYNEIILVCINLGSTKKGPSVMKPCNHCFSHCKVTCALRTEPTWF